MVQGRSQSETNRILCEIYETVQTNHPALPRLRKNYVGMLKRMELIIRERWDIIELLPDPHRSELICFYAASPRTTKTQNKLDICVHLALADYLQSIDLTTEFPIDLVKAYFIPPPNVNRSSTRFDLQEDYRRQINPAFAPISTPLLYMIEETLFLTPFFQLPPKVLFRVMKDLYSSFDAYCIPARLARCLLLHFAKGEVEGFVINHFMIALQVGPPQLLLSAPFVQAGLRVGTAAFDALHELFVSGRAFFLGEVFARQNPTDRKRQTSLIYLRGTNSSG